MRPETYPWNVQEIQVLQKRETVSGWLFLNQGEGCPGPHSTMVLGCGRGRDQAFYKEPMWSEQLLKMAG